MTLKNALKANGYSARDFAKLIGVSRQAVYLWINGDTYPSSEHRKAMQIVLGANFIFTTEEKQDAENHCRT